WTVVATVTSGGVGSLGSLLAVTDRSTIWAAAQEEAGPVDHPVLAVSRDAGRTWLDVTLPGMTATEGGTNIVPLAPPTFFDPEHGAFAVTTGDPAITGDPSGDPRTFIFTTSDGGRSWALRTRLSFDAQTVAFISAMHWVLSVNGLAATIVVTDDGGGSWSQVATSNLPDGPILQINRIDSVHALGYVLVGGNTGDPGAIVISSDGGRTWREVAPAAP
ncbi:MAG TPA: YCF48-related protein, partial [Candidatus Limnocylindrales bacterium]|nr:YCF48-related protein [Candidatus Limnocylindrales bacterium]